MIRHSKDGYCISLPFVVKCSCKPPEKTTTLLPPVITTDNNLITAHRIGWIIWTHQIIKKMRYQIYEAKSVKHDAQQRVGINKNQTGIVSPAGPVPTGPAGFAIVPVIDGGIGPAGAGSGGGGGRQVAGTDGERPQAAPARP